MLHVKNNPFITIHIEGPDGYNEKMESSILWSSLELEYLDLQYVVDIERDSESGNVYAEFAISEHDDLNSGEIMHITINIKDIHEFADYDTAEQCKVVYDMLVGRYYG